MHCLDAAAYFHFIPGQIMLSFKSLVDCIVLLCIFSFSVFYYAALLPRRGPHIASHSVCPSVCLSVRPVIVIERHVAPPSELQWHTCTFRHALRAAYRTAISAAQILDLHQLIDLLHRRLHQLCKFLHLETVTSLMWVERNCFGTFLWIMDPSYVIYVGVLN